MPSLRQKVTTYFRQLSFIAEPRDSPRGTRKSADDDNFIIKYLEGRMERQFSVPGPEIFNGQTPTDLPDLNIGTYPTGPTTITAACTGPDEGLTGIKRSKLHLSASYADDIDFIDTTQETTDDCFEVRKSINATTTTTNRNQNKLQRFGGGSAIGQRKLSNNAINNTTTANDQNANKPTTGMRSRKNSRTSISNLKPMTSSTASTNKTTAGGDKKLTAENANKSTTIVVSMVSTTRLSSSTKDAANDQNNKNILNSTVNDMESSKALTTVCANMGNAVDATTKELLDNTTERLLLEAVSNQQTTDGKDLNTSFMLVDAIAGVTDWHQATDYAYGISVSLYETNMLTKEPMGSPIADCYGIVVRGDVAAMALADGVNWGDGARLAARSAVHGCLDYLDRAIFGMASECMATTTTEVYVSLLRSLWEGHGCILEVGGSLSTLTIAVVLPLTAVSEGGERDANAVDKYVVCACNVGDSLGYVYSKKYGVREITQASHDITSMRDMRDALGALGPADGNKPELGNLTFSMTVLEKGDIVFLTSDGVSDNFDPVVGKFAEAWTPDVKMFTANAKSQQQQQHNLAPKRQNKSASSIYARLHHTQTPTQPHSNTQQQQRRSSAETESVPTSAPAGSSGDARLQRTKKSSASSTQAAVAATTAPAATAPSRPKYMRSHTVIEPRRLTATAQQHVASRHHALQRTPTTLLPKIPKSIAGLPLVTGPQRHALTLYRLEDLLSYGINGTFSPCTSARRLCHLLIDFVRMITSARRKTLEQRELFYKLSTGPDGIRREVALNRMQHRVARKRVIDSATFSALPGKLDHATVVAYTVGIARNTLNGCNTDESGGNGGGTENVVAASTSHVAAGVLQAKNFSETNF